MLRVAIKRGAARCAMTGRKIDDGFIGPQVRL
jgi:hypothetical protein